MLDTFIENIMNEKDSKNEDSSYENPKMSQENIVKDATNIGNAFFRKKEKKLWTLILRT